MMALPSNRPWWWPPRGRRSGRVLASGIWLGPKDGPDAVTCARIVCQECRGEGVVAVSDVWIDKSIPEVKVRRLDDGSVDIRTVETGNEFGLATCPTCGVPLEVRLVGRDFTPWKLGAGRIVPMPDFHEAPTPEGGPPA